MKAANKNKYLPLAAALFVLLGSVPYLWGLTVCPGDGSFIGYTRNIDDMAVYMSWVKQTALGSIVTENLFQDKQGGAQFNVYILVLGFAARLAGGLFRHPETAVLHLARLLQALALPWVFYSFSGLFLSGGRSRLTATLIFLFGGGFGFFLPGAVDAWQPEAVTFMSAYLNPLFTAALILMLLCLGSLLRGRLWQAGLWLFLLGNVHTYDTVIVALLWAFAALWEYGRTRDLRRLLLHIASGAAGAVSVAVNCAIYLRDPIYRSRVDTVISTPEIWYVLAGFGLPLLLACAALIMVKKGRLSLRQLPVLVFWLLAGLAILYIPFSQQRKFIMGYMIPVSLLAGPALAQCLSRTGGLRRALCALAVLVLAAGNLTNIHRDMTELSAGTTAARFSPWMSRDEERVMDWIAAHAGPGDVIMAPPQTALFIPGYTGRRVYYGHWSETPDYSRRTGEYMKVLEGAQPRCDILVLPRDAREDLEDTAFETETFRIVRVR